MTITSIKIFRYHLPFSLRFSFRKRVITAREGLIIKLTLDKDIEGFGEIAPLPGFSDYGIEECLKNLQDMESFLKNEQFSYDNLEGELFVKLDKISMYPEVRFGIEMAVFNAAACQQHIPLSKLLSTHAAQKVALNGLLADSSEPVELRVERLLQDGYKLIKVKAGASVAEDILLLKDVSKALNNRAQVSVDANRKWSFAEANLFAKELRGCDIKYIEEPFSDVSKIPEFFRNTGIPVALDEAVYLQEFDYSKPPEGVKFLVLKPTLIGGIRKVLRLINEAGKSGVQFIISSSFESGIGLFTLGSLAASAGKNVTAGLDTLKWFENDLLKKPLPISKGQIDVSGKIILESDILLEYLTEL